MTTTTVHRIDVADLRTFRLRCGKCRRTSLAEVENWVSNGGRAKCIHCGVDWEHAGQNLASLMAGLRELCKAQNPEVQIQAEVDQPHRQLDTN